MHYSEGNQQGFRQDSSITIVMKEIEVLVKKFYACSCGLLCPLRWQNRLSPASQNLSASSGNWSRKELQWLTPQFWFFKRFTIGFGIIWINCLNNIIVKYTVVKYTVEWSGILYGMEPRSVEKTLYRSWKQFTRLRIIVVIQEGLNSPCRDSMKRIRYLNSQ